MISLEVYTLCVMMISLEVWMFGSVQNCKWTNKFGNLEVYKIVNGPISLEVWKLLISLEVHIVCDDDKFGSLEVSKCTEL